MNLGHRLRQSVVMTICCLALWQSCTGLVAQDWERWLRTQPYTPPQYDRTPQIFPAPPGQVFPYHQEAHPTNLQRRLRQLRHELALASMSEDEPGVPSLSEINDIENQLFEAALRAEIASRSLAMSPLLEEVPPEPLSEPATPSTPLPPVVPTASAPDVTQPAASPPATIVPARPLVEKPPVNIEAPSLPNSPPVR